MSKYDYCCNHDCNQGRSCPAKPIRVIKLYPTVPPDDSAQPHSFGGLLACYVVQAVAVGIGAKP